MPGKPNREELERVLAAIAENADGLTFKQLGERLGASVPRRTLQRRLAQLLEEARVRAEGTTTDRIYFVHPAVAENPAAGRRAGPGDGSPAEPADASTPATDPYIDPVSPEGAEVRRLVRRPIHERQPVGYQRDWLEDYRPNETRYLDEATCGELARLGSLPESVVPAGTYSRVLHQRLLIDLSWNSSRLEGNTYSLLETERLIELGETAQGKDATEAQMILNHKSAIEMLTERPDDIRFDRLTILNLHAVLADNLLPDPAAGGRLRTTPVGIGNSTFIPLAVPQLIEECFRALLDKARQIRNPFEQSFFAMVHLPYLQPFIDINKRVSRLAANIPLIARRLCPLSFVDVPQRAYVDGLLGVYELNRVELLRDVYVWAYRRSCQRYTVVLESMSEPDPFRVKHRTLIFETVGEVVRTNTGVDGEDYLISRRASKLPMEEQVRFAQTVRTELDSLHEGNIARYRLRPSEFANWQARRNKP